MAAQEADASRPVAFDQAGASPSPIRERDPEPPRQVGATAGSTSSERLASPARAEAGVSRMRRTDLQVPVAEDARLPVNDWLERVRTRYGLGDEQAARQSLLMFVEDHPREPVPGDLEPLLER